MSNTRKELFAYTIISVDDKLIFILLTLIFQKSEDCLKKLIHLKFIFDFKIIKQS